MRCYFLVLDLLGFSPTVLPSSKTSRTAPRAAFRTKKPLGLGLYFGVLERMRFHTPTLNYVERRTAEGRPKRRIIRCLKRVLAGEIFQRVMADYRARQAADLAA